MVRRSQQRMLAAIAVTIALLASFAPANANWFGPSGAGGGGAGSCPTGGNITEDKNVDFHNVDPSAALTDGSSFTRSLLASTALSVSYTSPQNTSIDVLLGDQYYDSFCEAALGVQWTTDGFSGLRGLQVCDYLNGNRCGQGVVRISNHYFDQHGQQGDRWITCHEVGHAIGLAHRNDAAGCMRDGVDVSNASYTGHDTNHFSANWSTQPPS